MHLREITIIDVTRAILRSRKLSESHEINLYKDIELKAFKDIVKKCYEITDKPEVLQFTTLLKMSENIISSNNETMREPKRKYLQRNLENLNIIKFQKYRENIIHLSKSFTCWYRKLPYMLT